jgi:Fic/DOC family
VLLEKAAAIPDPFEQAFFVMVHLPYLQPFIDVNKRTSRLGANLPLIKANLCPLSFVDVPEQAYVEGTLGVYELRRVALLRDVFVWAYERSCAEYVVVRQAVGRPDPIRLAYREHLREVVREMVQRLTVPDPGALDAWGAAHGVKEEDRTAFVDAARAELLDLHEGSLRRYRLLPSEFAAWERHVASG